MAEEALFIYSGGNREGNYLRWRFFLLFFFVSCRKDKMRACLGTATAGQKGQTRGPVSAREVDVRQEDKDENQVGDECVRGRTDYRATLTKTVPR